LCNIGLIYLDKSDFDGAVEYESEGLKIAREIGYPKCEALGLANIGVIYKAKGDPANALEYLEQAKAVLDRHGLAHGRDVIEAALAEIHAAEKAEGK